MRTLGHCNTPGSAWGVYVSGSYAYVADQNAGLRIINVSNPSSPYETGYYDTPGCAEDVYVSGSYAYVADGSAGLRIINVSNPSSPYETGYYDTPDYAWGVYAAGSYVYVADAYSGLRIIDISVPTNPQEVGFYDTPDYAFDVFVSDSIAFVADRHRLWLLDVSMPTNPQPLGSYYYDTTSEEVDGVHVSSSFCYISCYPYGLRIIDFTNPSNPQEIGSYETIGNDEDVYVFGSYAYLATSWNAAGLRIVDVSTPINPQLVGSYDTPDLAQAIFASGPYVYVAERDTGFWIYEFYGYDINESMFNKLSMQWLHISPNPFYRITTINFLTPSTGSQIMLKIYDVSGKLVKSFPLSTDYRLLSTSVSWNGSDDLGHQLPAGVYFCRLETKEFTETKKIIKLE